MNAQGPGFEVESPVISRNLETGSVKRQCAAGKTTRSRDGGRSWVGLALCVRDYGHAGPHLYGTGFLYWLLRTAPRWLDERFRSIPCLFVGHRESVYIRRQARPPDGLTYCSRCRTQRLLPVKNPGVTSQEEIAEERKIIEEMKR